MNTLHHLPGCHSDRGIRLGVWKLKFVAGVVAATLAACGQDATPPSSGTQSQQEQHGTIVRAYFPSLQLARRAVKAYDTLESEYETGYLIIDASPKDIAALEAEGFQVVEDPQWLAEQQALVAQAPLSAAGIPGYTCYETVEETFTAAADLATAHPDLASWFDAGNSWQKTMGLGGYDLMVLKLTNSAATGVKPKLFIMSAIHAREYATAGLTLAFAKQLVNGYGTDPDTTWILDNHEIHFLFHTNPDGRKHAETGVLWRKNTNQNYCGPSSSDRGADLNRNFTFDWNSTGGAGSSGDPCAEDYRGPSAASEPEVQAVEAYVRGLYTDRRGPGRTDPAPADTSGLHLDIHSHGRLLLWPWGTPGAVAGNDTQLQTLGRKLAYWNSHTPQRSLDLYPTDGTSDGVSYGELGVPSFTFELGTAFFQSCTYFTNTLLPANLPSLLYAAKVARTPYVTPAGPDAYSLALSNGGTAPGVAPGTPVTLTAVLDDTRYNNSNGSEPIYAITAGEYYLDTPPWNGGVAVPMSASDGSFNSTKETVTATVQTTGLSAGKHMLFVRGQGTNAVWGALGAAFLFVTDGTNQPPVANFTTAANGLTVTFTDTSTDDGTITGWLWNFGDSTTSTSSNPVHTYAAGGTYTVTLQVTDNGGLTGNTSKPVVVQPPDGVTELTNGQTVTSLSAAYHKWLYYKINVPTGATNLTIAISGGSGDADLYTRFGAKPTTSLYDCRPYLTGNNESCTVTSPTTGYTYIGLRAYSAFSGVTLTASYTP